MKKVSDFEYMTDMFGWVLVMIFLIIIFCAMAGVLK